jgi:hypothetical protein
MKREEYISDETVIKHANAAVRIELEKNRALRIPTVIYDRKRVFYTLLLYSYSRSNDQCMAL